MKLINTSIIFLLLCCSSCVHESNLEGIEYNPEPYILNLPDYFPQMPLAKDNPLTKEGIILGRDLFYDKKLSANNTMSCVSCHDPRKAFTDGLAVSVGIDGIAGKRSAMSLVNIGFTKSGLFWDGRSATLEEQALLPVEDEIELNTTWPEVEMKLQNDPFYPEMFRKAFGIKNKSEITKYLVAKALSQYQRIILSSNSKYDRYKKGEEKLSDLELIGLNLYTDSTGDDLPDAECHHCHQLDLATADNFFNNGLQESATLNDFKDLGKGGVTKQIAENGKMRAPTLRNIFLSAPYMHDGRFNTMDEVLNHYNGNGKNSPNKDPLIRDLKLSSFHKKALLAFISTLTDTSYLNNPLIVKK
jgi:cytochrome c peroxidase